MQSDGYNAGAPNAHDVEDTPADNQPVKLDYYSVAAIRRLLSKTEQLNLELQPASLDIWNSKYALRDYEGNRIDADVNGTFARVAKALADVEREEDREYWKARFMLALQCGATPAGRITSNAGAGRFKPGTSLINCTVSGSIPDSMHGILTMAHEAGMTLKAGCGIGYEFSTLRPRGATVAGVGSETSGPLSFMEIFDKVCATVASAGGRRGAQMATFDVHHPDVMDFIKAKREDGRLRQFNLSLLITEDFIEAVKNDEDWNLSFPLSMREARTYTGPTRNRFMPWLTEKDRYAHNDKGEVVCRIYSTIKARELWDTIMQSTYDFAEPGFIMIDQVNKSNNNWYCEDIRATNPCGEQPLPPYGSCLLGSVSLSRFVVNPFTPEVSFDWAAYREVIRIFSRMLDNVVEIHGLPLDRQAEELRQKRRHGMGFLGLGSTLALLGIKYGSPESVQFTEKVAYVMAYEGYDTGVELAIEKGMAPILDQDFTVTPDMAHKNGTLETLIGTNFKGRELMVHSGFMNRFAETVEGANLLRRIEQYGCRYTHATSIAPTGTISLSLANNASNGIEPTFGHQYFRNVIVPGRKTKERVSVFSYELLAWRNHLAATGQELPPEDDLSNLPESFVTTDDLLPSQHVDIQAAAQKWVDSSISKTCNVPTDIDFEDFKGIYLYAAEQGLKGCTTFRFNPEAFQGVLVKKEDLQSTTYVFTLEDGSTFTAKGDEMLEYDGQLTSAANLGDALKEGTYARY